jgi:Ca2+-binding RTX toxin-like protein
MAIFTGTTGDDSILGTAAGDDFHLEQGGEDTASGGGGIDAFYFGAAFSAGDQLTGGAGRDFLVLDGDYSEGLTFAKHQLKSISDIYLTASHSYVLGGLDHVRGALRIDGSDLGVGEALSVDGSGRAFALDVRGGGGADFMIGGAGVNDLSGGAGDDTLAGGDGGNSLSGGDGADSLTGGTGADRLSGGAGGDVLLGGEGADQLDGGDGNNSLDGGGGNDSLFALGGRQTMEAGGGDDQLGIYGQLDPGTVIDGGDGFDWLSFGGGSGALNLDGAQVQGIEKMLFNASYSVTVADDIVASGQVLDVVVSLLYPNSFQFDGSAETDGGFDITGNTSSEILIGGGGDDTLIGGGGYDNLTGGAGDDIIVGVAAFGTFAVNMDGGLGADRLYASGKGNHTTSTISYHDIADSTPADPDTIFNLGAQDFIYLYAIDADTGQADDQAFTIVDHFDGHAGELMLSYDHLRKLTNLEADVDGDGQADMLVVLTGKHVDFDNFAL